MKLRTKLKAYKFSTIALVVAMCLVAGGLVLAYTVSQTQNIETYNYYESEGQPGEVNFGAIPSPDVYQLMNFHSGIVRGGYTATSTSAATYTLATGDIGRESSYWEITPTATTTITTMATSSVAMDNLFIPNTGDTREIVVYNNSAIADDLEITLAAGTGVDLQKNEDTADLKLEGSDSAILTFVRKANTDVLVIFDQYGVAD